MRWFVRWVGIVLHSGLIHLAYSLCLQRGYQAADLSVIYPVARGTGPMLATVAAVVVLSEVLTARKLFGLVLIVVEIGLIATRADLPAFRRTGGRLLGRCDGRACCLYTVVDADAVRALAIAPVVLDWLFNMRVCIVATRPREALSALRGSWLTAIGVGILSPLGYILFLAALSSRAPFQRRRAAA